MSIKNNGHYFCRAGGNRPDGLNEPVTHTLIHLYLIGVVRRKRRNFRYSEFVDF
ncbi:copper resistance protein [Escherichia coli]|nr:copper resistance protein [Escherichia coli]